MNVKISLLITLFLASSYAIAMEEQTKNAETMASYAEAGYTEFMVPLIAEHLTNKDFINAITWFTRFKICVAINAQCNKYPKDIILRALDSFLIEQLNHPILQAIRCSISPEQNRLILYQTIEWAAKKLSTNELAPPYWTDPCWLLCDKEEHRQAIIAKNWYPESEWQNRRKITLKTTLGHMLAEEEYIKSIDLNFSFTNTTKID